MCKCCAFVACSRLSYTVLNTNYRDLERQTYSSEGEKIQPSKIWFQLFLFFIPPLRA